MLGTLIFWITRAINGHVFICSCVCWLLRTLIFFFKHVVWIPECVLWLFLLGPHMTKVWILSHKARSQSGIKLTHFSLWVTYVLINFMGYSIRTVCSWPPAGPLWNSIRGPTVSHHVEFAIIPQMHHVYRPNVLVGQALSYLVRHRETKGWSDCDAYWRCDVWFAYKLMKEIIVNVKTLI